MLPEAERSLIGESLLCPSISWSSWPFLAFFCPTVNIDYSQQNLLWDQKRGNKRNKSFFRKKNLLGTSVLAVLGSFKIKFIVNSAGAGSSEHCPDRYQRVEGMGRPKSTGKITHGEFWWLKKLRQAKAKPVAHTSLPCWANPQDVAEKSAQRCGQHYGGCGKEKCHRMLLRAPMTSLMLRKYLIEEDCQNTKVGLKGSENLLKAFVLFLKDTVPFFLRAVKPTLQKM